ncbi:MAG: GNAT family N-acetyltransferase [Cyclobacteriaceae bacterium]
MIELREDRILPREQLIELYKANQWSSSEKPVELMNGLLNSHSLITAWIGDKLVGLGNAISDGYLVVYYPHLIVHLDYHGQGIGTLIVKLLSAKYKDFHQQMLTADGRAIEFYKKCGFERAGQTEPMWIYKGNEH